MATSPYFNNQGATREQWLLEDLIIESIRNHGIDIYYIPRDSQSSLDELYGDDPVKCFTEAIKIDMYLETFSDYTGNKEFFSKFGLEIQETAKVAVARRTFERFVPKSLRNLPKEGDLIYLPVQMKLMEVKFVEEERNFFQLGRDSRNPYMYALTIEAFKYNGELINTGHTEIDNIADYRAFGIDYTMSAGGSGTFDKQEIVYQGASLATATAKGYVSDWNVVTRKLRIRNIKGEFAPSVAVVGTISGASWNISSGDDMENATSLFDDNTRIETEADNFLDFSEANPFGEP
jgi:Virus neck protein